jgi:hypothetical protein
VCRDSFLLFYFTAKTVSIENKKAMGCLCRGTKTVTKNKTEGAAQGKG